MASYPFTEIQPFSEERAWVEFNKDNTICTGIIDADGKLLYQAEGRFSYFSQFKDGTTFYRESSEETSPCGIIDLEGNLLFESQITSDGGYLILGYGEGQFFVAQHLQNFDADEWRYGTIDKNGNVVNEMKEFRIDEYSYLVSAPDIDYEIKYIGENYMEFADDNKAKIFYNLSAAEIVFPDVNYRPITEFREGYALCDAPYNGYAYIIMSVDEWLECINLNYDMYSCYENPYYYDGRTDIDEEFGWVNGLVLGSPYHFDQYELKGDYGYYDKDWNLVISLEKYRDKEIKGGPFGGGYAAVTLRGADGYYYASAVDQSGDLAYDPVKIDSGELNDSANGYFQVVIDDEKKIINPNGAIYTPGIDDLSMLKELTFGDVSGGFIIMSSEENNSDVTPYYASLDANTIIDSVKVTSADMDIIEDEPWSDETSEDSSYIVPDSYDITGKWKSVGDSGFGQAQPGAIVVFDGNNCNFYSPKDTYAFYKEGDRYILDITSVLGENLSQTVNIIDDNNIEIAGASLRRME